MIIWHYQYILWRIVMNILAYHGTDYNIAKLIITQGFTFNKNPEHWLGNGIYLYQDYSLAKWWTTNPTKNLGTM